MKNFQLPFFALLVTLSLSCCSKLQFVANENSDHVNSQTTTISKSDFYSGLDELNCSNTFVTEKDIQAYLKYMSIARKTDLTEGEISHILDSLGDTILYVVNYPTSGWELIAADKRCPAVIASDNEGYFVYEEQIPPVQAWLRCIEEEITQVRSISSYEEVKDEDALKKMQNAQRFWKMITADSSEIQNKMEQTKDGLDPIPYADGYWDIYDVVIDTVSYQHIDHLVQTHWDQHPPYNAYCPFLSYSMSQRALAGCVAVAAGQVANYFNSIYGYPDDAPLTAFCDAQIPSGGCYLAGSDSHMYVSNLSTAAWDSIPSSGNMCAKLLAEIGIAVDMEYRDNITESWELGESYFQDKGFFLASGVFNPDYMINNITANKPVIAAAEDIGIHHNRHAFIIDGYESVYERYTTYYVWVTYEPVPWDPIIVPYDEDYFTTQQITMNWGFGEYYDNAWYSINANWPASDCVFGTTGRQMVYDLSLSL